MVKNTWQYGIYDSDTFASIPEFHSHRTARDQAETNGCRSLRHRCHRHYRHSELLDRILVFRGRKERRRHLSSADSLERRMASFWREPPYRPGYPSGPDIGHDAGSDNHGIIHGPHILFRVHERRDRFPEVLLLPLPVHDEHAGTRGSHEHFPDVYLLGACRSQLLSSDRVLLYEERGSRCVKKTKERQALLWTP